MSIPRPLRYALPVALALLLIATLVIHAVSASPVYTTNTLDPAYAAAVSAIDPNAGDYMTVVGTKPVTWPECQPLYYVSNSPAGFDPYVKEAVAEISAASGISITPLVGSPKGKLIITFVWQDQSSFQDPGAWAHTLDSTNFKTNTYTASHIYLRTNLPYFYLQHIIMHELGHVVGLDHQPSPASLMYYANNNNFTQTDKDLLRSLGPQHICAAKS